MVAKMYWTLSDKLPPSRYLSTAMILIGGSSEMANSLMGPSVTPSSLNCLLMLRNWISIYAQIGPSFQIVSYSDFNISAIAILATKSFGYLNQSASHFSNVGSVRGREMLTIGIFPDGLHSPQLFLL